MNPSLAEAIGVNVENLLISQPDSAENLLSIVNTLTKSGSMDVIVVDSVSASLYNSRLILFAPIILEYLNNSVCNSRLIIYPFYK